jgi:hypothetical protein
MDLVSPNYRRRIKIAKVILASKNDWPSIDSKVFSK